jgi:hypothetical protein
MQSRRRAGSLVAVAAGTTVLLAPVGRGGGDLLEVDSGQVGHAERGEHLHGLLVDADLVNLERRFLRDEVHAALALLLLQIERDAGDGAALDAAHEVGAEAGHLVAEALGGADGHLLEHLLVGVEVEGHARVVLLDDLPGGLLHGLGADATHSCWWTAGSGSPQSSSGGTATGRWVVTAAAAR